MDEFQIHIARKADLQGLLSLYTQLHDNPVPERNQSLEKLWNQILEDPNRKLLIGVIGQKIIASCDLILVPNLTHNQRPYGIIENVITWDQFRSRGYGTRLMEYAAAIAKEQNCYKIMLMTGSKNESTLNFYRRAGYNSEDKTAFIQWLEP